MAWRAKGGGQNRMDLPVAPFAGGARAAPGPGHLIGPQRRLRRFFLGRRSLLTLAFAVGLIGSTFATGQSVASGDDPVATNAQVLAAVQAAQSITRVPSDLTPALTNQNDIEVLRNGDCPSHYDAPRVGLDALHFGECTYGDPQGKHLLVIFGDSHAGMWLSAIRYAAARTGWRVKIFYFPGCPAPDLTFYSNQTGNPDYACNDFRKDAIKAIRDLHPAMVVVTSADIQRVGRDQDATAAEWEQGYSTTLSMLKMPGTQLVVVGDIPYLAQNDPVCLAAHLSDAKACATPLSAAETGVLNPAEEQAAAANDAKYLDTRQWVCAQLCVPIVGHIRVYNDQYHLSATYAKYLSGAIQTALGLGN
jgi:hypothetical protein